MLARDPKATGRIVNQISILEDGRVVGACVTASTLSDQAFLQCVSDVFAGLHFDPQPGCGKTRVTYPLVFAPAEEPE